MATFSKTQLNVIANAVIKRLSRVPFNGTWQKIYRQLEIGQPDGAGKYLHFSGEDAVLLREMVKVEAGVDVLNLDFDVDRMAISTLTSKEKYANIRPEANYVLVKAPFMFAGKMHFDEFGLFDEQTAFRLHVDRVIDVCRQQPVSDLIIVENLDIFDAVAQGHYDSIIQQRLSSTLFIYRGGGIHSAAGPKSLLKLIQRDTCLSRKITVSAFVDLDPAGLQIACLLRGCTQLILPELAVSQPCSLLNIPQINDPSDYFKQIRQVSYLEKTALGKWKPLFTWIMKNKVSIKQQHMLTRNLMLSSVYRNS
ncbi:DUF7281 domain-containing protein [Shewanella marisflavi]|uniref:DUF7281 domain-containing protein n=1 Tax=Shewanella marisflavi TaxID=260364 RepID=A0AAC9XPJ2_9GAMM|nr:hypothetical protein [Shewanella marisflavi]ASJ97912.1 hypothetical protein CFF01_15665 [Shewanella marisflavi]